MKIAIKYTTWERLTQAKQDQLQNCKTIPHFYLSIEGWRYDSTIKTYLYTTEIGLDCETVIMTYKFEKRYSQYNKLYKTLNQEISGLKSGFPPKVLMINHDIEKVRNRQRGLQNYFSQFSAVDDILKHEDFNKFFSFDCLKDLWLDTVTKRSIADK